MTEYPFLKKMCARDIYLQALRNHKSTFEDWIGWKIKLKKKKSERPVWCCCYLLFSFSKMQEGKNERDQITCMTEPFLFFKFNCNKYRFQKKKKKIKARSRKSCAQMPNTFFNAVIY